MHPERLSSRVDRDSSIHRGRIAIGDKVHGREMDYPRRRNCAHTVRGCAVIENIDLKESAVWNGGKLSLSEGQVVENKHVATQFLELFDNSRTDKPRSSRHHDPFVHNRVVRNCLFKAARYLAMAV